MLRKFQLFFKTLFSKKWVMQLISLTVLFFLIRYYNLTDTTEVIQSYNTELQDQVEENVKSTSDQNLEFIVFQQAQMSNEIKKLKRELEKLEMKAGEAHLVELRQWSYYSIRYKNLLYNIKFSYCFLVLRHKVL
jgi:hypothetical protein